MQSDDSLFSLDPPPRRPKPPASDSRLAPSQASLTHRAAIHKKSALRVPEPQSAVLCEEPNFMQVLMSRLREHCAEFDAFEAPTAPSRVATKLPPPPSDAVLWAIVQENNRRTFFRGSGVPLELILLCFEYLNVIDLCTVSAVNRRCNVVASFPFLWLQHCQRFCLTCTMDPFLYNPRQDSITTENPAKKMVREYIQEARKALVETLDEERQRLRQIEERLQQRRDIVAAAPPFATELIHSTQEHQPQLIQLIQRSEQHVRHMTEQSAHFEALRKGLLADSAQNKQTIAKIEQEIRALRRKIEHPVDERSETNHGTDLQTGTTISTTKKAGGSSFSSKLSFRSSTVSESPVAPNSASHSPSTLRAQIETFERKICAFVLSPLRDLPLVIRRGTRTFSDMELLVLQVGSGSAGGALLQKRWSTLLGLFPLRSDAYMDLVEYAWSGEGECSAKSNNLIPMIRKMSSWSHKDLEGYFA